MNEYLFPFWKGMTGCRNSLLFPHRFDVNFFIMGIDIIHSSFRSDAVLSGILGGEGGPGRMRSGRHSGTEGRVVWKQGLAGTLGQQGKGQQGAGRGRQGIVHQETIIAFPDLPCQAPEEA